MIEKLHYHCPKDIKRALSGDPFGELLAAAYEDASNGLPPTDEEIVEKINEIIDYLNKMEDKKGD